MKNRINLSRIIKFILIIFTQLILAGNLFAAPKKKLPVKKPVFTQTIKWQPKQNNKGYYVVIQHKITTAKDKENILKKINQFTNYLDLEPEEQEEGWEDLITIETFETSLELTLPAGYYRWKLKYRNALNRVATASKWRPLNVIKAYKPEIDIFEPSEFYLDAPNESVLFIAGENISFDDTSISIYDPSNKVVRQLMATRYALDNLSNQYIDKSDPEFDEEDYNWTGVQIDPKKLGPGIYTIVLENRGGLTNTKTFEVKYKYPTHFEFTTGWNPSFICTESSLSNVMGNCFTKPAIFAEGCYLFTLTPWLRIGPEADITFYNFKGIHTAYTATFFGTIMDLNCEAQLYAPNRLFSVSLKAGGTFMTESYKIQRTKTYDNASAWYTGLNFGLSFTAYLPYHLQVKSGVSVKEIFRASELITIISPSLGVGVHF